MFRGSKTNSNWYVFELKNMNRLPVFCVTVPSLAYAKLSKELDIWNLVTATDIPCNVPIARSVIKKLEFFCALRIFSVPGILLFPSLFRTTYFTRNSVTVEPFAIFGATHVILIECKPTLPTRRFDGGLGEVQTLMLAEKLWCETDTSPNEVLNCSGGMIATTLIT